MSVPEGPPSGLEGSFPAEVADDEGNRLVGATARSVLDYVAKAIAEEPDAVSIGARERGNQLVLELSVAPSDMGRVIGRRGHVAQALRTLVRVAGSRDGVEATVDILD